MEKIKHYVLGLFLVIALFGVGSQVTHAALSSTQINAIISLLESFGSDTQTTENVRAALEGRAQGGNTDVACISLTHDLYIGQNDAKTQGDVSELQQFLRQTGDFRYSSITGYYGPVTERAVGRFQERLGVVSGVDAPGYGRVGPQTRSAIAGVPCQGDVQTNTNTSNRTFSIVLTEPNKGGLFSVGDPLEITWNSQNIDTVEVIIFTPDFGGASSTVNISGTIQNTGTFTWAIDKDVLPTKDGALADNYGIRVRGGTYSGVYDIANEYFKVTTEETATTDLLLTTQKGLDPSTADVTAAIKGSQEQESVRSYTVKVACQEGVTAHTSSGVSVCGSQKQVYTANIHNPENDNVVWEFTGENTNTKRAGITVYLEMYSQSDTYLGGDMEVVTLEPGGDIAGTVPVSLKTTVSESSGTQSDALTAYIGGSKENSTVGYWILTIGCADGVAVEKDGENICGTDLRVNTDDIADPANDYLLTEAHITDNREIIPAESSAAVTLTLNAYDRSSNILGGDKKEIILD